MHAPQRPIRPARLEHLEAIRALLRECELPVEDLTPDDHSHFLVVHEEAARLCPSTAPCLRKHLGSSEPPT